MEGHGHDGIAYQYLLNITGLGEISILLLYK